MDSCQMPTSTVETPFISMSSCQTLHKWRDLICLQADKGWYTVVYDTELYHEKVMTLLKDEEVYR